MKTLSQIIKQKNTLRLLLFIATIVIVFLLGLFASSIIERRAEAVFAYTPQVKHSQYEPRNNIWGQNYPRQYQSYLRTADTTFRSKYNGNAMVDMLEEDPRMVILWAGYAFSRDYKQGRGHAHAITDIHNTLRTGAPADGVPSIQPNTCWACKSPDVPRVMEQIGVAQFYNGTWDTRGHQIVNHIGCADCHDATTMNLRISRPALLEAYNRLGIDIAQVSHQQMRSLVCAQCHVEYYFNKQKPVKNVSYLTFPWDNGFTAENIEQYYDSINFTDWTHALSKAPMLKAQHPDFEVYNTGVHASRGVACADCHMPYNNEGGQKFTNHQLQSPLNNVANSCQVCHREETQRLVKDVYERQDKIFETRIKLEELLVQAHFEAQLAWQKGATPQQMDNILTDIRHAQWRWDYAAAGHGNSFHSPVETSRVITNGIVIANNARVKLIRLLAVLGHTQPVQYPDIDTKHKAQKLIGLPMEQLNNDKKIFLKTVVPQWIKTANQREQNYNVENM